jgi:hypothetical protein
MSWHVLTCSDLIIVVFSMLAALIDLEDVKHNGWQLLAAYNVQCWPWFLVNFRQPLAIWSLCVSFVPWSFCESHWLMGDRMACLMPSHACTILQNHIRFMLDSWISWIIHESLMNHSWNLMAEAGLGGWQSLAQCCPTGGSEGCTEELHWNILKLKISQ